MRNYSVNTTYLLRRKSIDFLQPQNNFKSRISCDCTGVLILHMFKCHLIWIFTCATFWIFVSSGDESQSWLKSLLSKWSLSSVSLKILGNCPKMPTLGHLTLRKITKGQGLVVVDMVKNIKLISSIDDEGTRLFLKQKWVKTLFHMCQKSSSPFVPLVFL